MLSFDFTPCEKILLEALVRHGKYGKVHEKVNEFIRETGKRRF